MKKVLQITLMSVLTLISSSIFSQNEKLGKVTIEELSEKEHPYEPSANAAILYKKANVYFQLDGDGYWQVIHEVEMKVKIYKKEGYKYANFEESYYTGVNGETLNFSNEATYNLVNGKVEKTKLKSDGEFKEESNKYYNTKKITLPNVKEGSIIEFKYTKTSYNLTRLVNFYFQFDIPVNFIELKITHSDSYVYNKTTYGYEKPEITNQMISVLNASYSYLKSTYSFKNLNSMKDEDFVNNINNYRARIVYELASRKDSKGFIEYFATDWESVAKKIYEEDSFGKELEKKNYYEDDIIEVLNGINSKDARTLAIFNFVKERMNWNEYSGLFCEDGVKTAYKNKVGNSAEINLMLISMLRYAGIEANPILLSTRSNGISLFPSRTGYNYVICGVEVDNEVVLLDATSKNAYPDILPIRDLNWFGRIIRTNKSSAEIALKPKMNSKDVITLMASINKEGEIEGKIRRQLSEYNAFIFRENDGNLTETSYIEKLENSKGGIDISEYSLQSLKELSKPIIQTFSFKETNKVEIIGDKMYFSPMLFYTMNENPFKQEKRKYPIDFSFPFTDKYSLNYQIPEGYEVESLPEALMLDSGSNIALFKYAVSSNGNKIQASVSFDINEPTVLPDYYDGIKVFFQKMIDKQNEKIVLKKI